MADLRNNTIFGWVLGAGIAAVGLSALSAQYFKAGHPEVPEKAGYEIAGVEAEGGDSGPSLNTLLATGDAAKGEQVFKKCTACHTVNSGGANGIGPNLWAIVGDPVAHGRGGFAFSDALKTKGGTWDFATLDEWFKSPAKFAPGTKMSFAGLGSAEDRANLIVYMNTQGSNKPLPAADAAEPAAEQPAAEGGAKQADGTETPPAAAEGTTTTAAPADGTAGEKPAVDAPKAGPSTEQPK